MPTKFLNPAAVIAQTGLQQGEVVADLGCGHGFYVLPAAQMVGPSGTVYAVDLMEEKLGATISISNQFGYKNVRVVQADLSKPFTEIADNSCDLVIVGSILHLMPQKDQLIKNVYRLLKPGGRVVAVEWKKSVSSFGPPMDSRVDQEKLEVMLMQTGMKKDKELQADGYHYAVLFEK